MQSGDVGLILIVMEVVSDCEELVLQHDAHHHGDEPVPEFVSC